jgi:cobalt-zinc-cadmium resistance protein CzcA
MLDRIINWSISNKLIIFLLIAAWIGFGIYALTRLSIGAVPDVTNNQVQVITTSRNLATEDVEKYLTYPVELEMANLPGVKEIRSISKFGLSVVTIVFDDDMGTYLPRQLIAERIKIAQDQIPDGFGQPFMGPISTGLGEIYQYVIDVKPGFEDQYSITDLRTIQDWVVRRQLSGIEGVVEVNTWGGFLKQYEVAINPERLKAVQVSLNQVYDALKKNNSIAGGSYIEKTNESFFIRGEGLVKSLEDIGNIVVEVRAGTPLYIKDIAKVDFGHANRFGAVTANGEGEKVLGQVMMLKGAGSKATIDRVKERLVEIESSLPDGVVINGFLDRSELIGRTTFTIAENLILGCLIVIFVVVVLLGNIRSGLVVASVIPLSLLFAISMMYLFGVDANLMSLGAIDFGIIIDGAVIIVEYIAFRFTKIGEESNQLTPAEIRLKKDEVSLQGASKMMHSAIFGQIIIIIVFIPILSLSGVEGKMFRPMAEVFSFALVGAMILGLTYVPVVSSLFLKTTPPGPKNISVRIINAINKGYEPAIKWALDHTKAVLIGAFSLFVVTLFVFSRMGSEFVPTLDEGDFVIQPFLKTGTTLTNTVETMTKIESILMKFPEVKQIVTRIGAAEIPTDPMSMEETDVIVILHPPSEWTTVKTKDELADAFKDSLKIIPGLEFEFTQPIEMRFNELITGVRADLAIKVFGDDLDVLLQTAQKIEAAIQDVEGAADIIVEKVAGLPQMKIEYDRAKVGRFGLNIEDLNQMVTMGFAGQTAGSVFEGEKQFDLVVRFEKEFRQDISNLENVAVQLPAGGSIPLAELAKISYAKGPAKISRENTRRRIVIGVNVRNRDLQSVVDDIQAIVATKIEVPEGYSVSYGGQFENLQQARSRLIIAVPIALFLIFVLLYFAFSSAKDAIMICSAIPLSAIGGVFLLWARDMPFSISAGVGFIALFGIAVLNGIVLIEHFKSMESKFTDLKELVRFGAKERLRPVLLTASAAALGFLPMAISSSAGAEVQRPLATVVVGGLFTATILTLFVLPVLYVLFKEKKEKLGLSSKVITTLVLFFLAAPLMAQEGAIPLTLEGALELAEARNLKIQAAEKSTEVAMARQGASWNVDKTTVYYGFDKNDIAENGVYNRVWGVSQRFAFPSLYAAQKNVLQDQALIRQQESELEKMRVRGEVSKAYLTVQYFQSLSDNYDFLDSLYTVFANAAKRRFETGETNYLEKLTAAGKLQEIKLKKSEANQNYKVALDQLKLQLNWVDDLEVSRTQTDLKLDNQADWSAHPGIQYFEGLTIQAAHQVQVEKRKLLPDISVDLFRGTNPGPNAAVYPGFQTGLAIPLFFGSHRAQIKSFQLQQEQIALESESYENRLRSNYSQLQTQLIQQEQIIRYYEDEGRLLAEQLIQQAQRAYQEGEIDFLQYAQLLENSRNITLQYLQSSYEHELIILKINYLID